MPPESHVFTVSELIDRVNVDLQVAFGHVAVEGEVTNCKRAPSGHHYFTIKDGKAQLSVTLFSTYSRGLKFRIDNGLKVVVRGRLSVYPERGTFQLNAVAVEPAGLGALQLAFEQLKQRLQEEGLFEASRKKPIPMLPQRIAVVTSPSGAAIRDVLNVLGRRFQGLAIQIYPVRVQGPTAGREIAAAINNLSRWNLHDVILICRGGGSLEDLWAFNEEVVARAVAACAIPTISGVGHEIDSTICDYVADLRAPTPSAAAEIVVRAKVEICSQIDQTVRRIRGVVASRLAERKNRLHHLSSSDGLGLFPRRIQTRRMRLEGRRLALYRLLDQHAKVMRHRLNRTIEPLAKFPSRLAIRNRKAHMRLLELRVQQTTVAILRRRREALRGTVGTLEAVSPLSVLSRGYAIAFSNRKGRKRPIRDSASVEIGESLDVQLKRGRLICTVDAKTMGLESIWPVVK